MPYKDKAIRVPDGPGLGVKLDREKGPGVQRAVQRLGGYPYDQDPGTSRLDSILPNDRFADPKDDRAVHVPF